MPCSINSERPEGMARGYNRSRSRRNRPGAKAGSCFDKRLLRDYPGLAKQLCPLSEHERVRNPILRFYVARDRFLQVCNGLVRRESHCYLPNRI